MHGASFCSSNELFFCPHLDDFSLATKASQNQIKLFFGGKNTSSCKDTFVKITQK